MRRWEIAKKENDEKEQESTKEEKDEKEQESAKEEKEQESAKEDCANSTSNFKLTPLLIFCHWTVSDSKYLRPTKQSI